MVSLTGPKRKSVFQREYLTFNILDKCVLLRILQRINRICVCVCVQRERLRLIDWLIDWGGSFKELAHAVVWKAVTFEIWGARLQLEIQITADVEVLTLSAGDLGRISMVMVQSRGGFFLFQKILFCFLSPSMRPTPSYCGIIYLTDSLLFVNTDTSKCL